MQVLFCKMQKASFANLNVFSTLTCVQLFYWNP
jgi:hypothetical protein